MDIMEHHLSKRTDNPASFEHTQSLSFSRFLFMVLLNNPACNDQKFLLKIRKPGMTLLAFHRARISAISLLTVVGSESAI
ncbi:unnamed protein product, partial [Ilex paraguariensis]